MMLKWNLVENEFKDLTKNLILINFDFVYFQLRSYNTWIS